MGPLTADPSVPADPLVAAMLFSAIVEMDIPLAHSPRSLGENAQGEKLFSMFEKADCNSGGKLDSIITRLRRRSIISSTCSIVTGHSVMHAWQVVHCQSISCGM